MPRAFKTPLLLLLLLTAAACVGAVALLVSMVAPTNSALYVFQQARERTPGELIRYAEGRLEGHGHLQALALPALGWIQRRIERPVPLGALPTLGKGQQASALWPVAYDRNGVPLAAQPLRQRWVAPAPDLRVHSSAELAHALATAMPGQTVEIAPGDYLIDQRLQTGHAGTRLQPIVVRAAQPGSRAA